jgi:ATP-dependent DNA helicase PIF1
LTYIKAAELINPEKIAFTEIHRQKDDEFINYLNKVRDYSISNQEINYLNQKGLKTSELKENRLEIRLTTDKYIAAQENRRRLDLINEKEFVYESEIYNIFPKDKFPVPQYLHLKRGAQIMFVKNDLQNKVRRWVNGTITEIYFLSDEIIEVKLQDGEICQIEKETWENRVYKYNRREGIIESEVIETYRHFPIRLAWAITIHKSQGLTFDNVKVDLGTGTFVAGQLYVALSRCSSFEGLTLVREIMDSDIIIDERILEFDKNYFNQEYSKLHENNFRDESLVLQ